MIADPAWRVAPNAPFAGPTATTVFAAALNQSRYLNSIELLGQLEQTLRGARPNGGVAALVLRRTASRNDSTRQAVAGDSGSGPKGKWVRCCSTLMHTARTWDVWVRMLSELFPLL